MNSIPNLITTKNYTELINTCEQLEIQDQHLSEIYPVYLACCVLVQDLQTARYVRKRILANKINSAEIEAIWTFIVDLIKKNYPKVYEDLDQFEWSEGMQLLVNDIQKETRENMFATLSKAYQSIPLWQAAHYFGVSEDQALQELLHRGWTFNETTRILYTVKLATSTVTIAGHHDRFEKLADMVMSLEKF
ncbi:COP9 signalosome complex subunit 8 [Choanephora cucurbitarum]|uniref:COP9 signalosome complex subunit 8 n=1 Tax=Choanephora cucurbitarum TaxID=101091 RepID=A0A1C7NHG7_9FUNG|nr:COP9 signalosome complex subunit 8 [Choanephora cucurbitarum]